ncbi:MAG: hypothetical protein KGZ58_11280 [Ignavibacteriales bacterium]|nr:hypothetical protein [Ignavibacteriales bacterium]
MHTISKAIEINGIVNEQHQLFFEEPLTHIPSGKVRVILMFENEDEITEKEWLASALRNPVFEFLKDEREDIYTLLDAKPLDA